jgi:nucleoid-associated protein YgaU
MSSIVSRGVAVTLAACVFLGAEIAFAEEATETVRVPVGLVTQHQEPETVVVAKGDHLWKISERHLGARMNTKPPTSAIGPYWRDVIDENVANLRSGDPDLIYPGEVIEMPEPHLSEQR